MTSGPSYLPSSLRRLGRQTLVPSEDLPRPRHLVHSPLTCRLRPSPQLQVLDSVVAAHAVLVVDVLVRVQLAAEVRLHHETMFRVPLALPKRVVSVPARIGRPPTEVPAQEPLTNLVNSPLRPWRCGAQRVAVQPPATPVRRTVCACVRRCSATVHGTRRIRPVWSAAVPSLSRVSGLSPAVVVHGAHAPRQLALLATVNGARLVALASHAFSLAC